MMDSSNATLIEMLFPLGRLAVESDDDEEAVLMIEEVVDERGRP